MLWAIDRASFRQALAHSHEHAIEDILTFVRMIPDLSNLSALVQRAVAEALTTEVFGKGEGSASGCTRVGDGITASVDERTILSKCCKRD